MAPIELAKYHCKKIEIVIKRIDMYERKYSLG
jgi:hypothetical protein